MKLKLIQKMTTTLRGRLSLWYLASVGLIVVLFSTVVGGLFWVTLQGQIDHHVYIAVNEAQEIVQNYRGEERDQLIKNLVSARGMTVIVLSPDGAPVLETNSPDVAMVTEHQLQKILTLSSLSEPAPVRFTESNLRFAAMPVTVSAGKGIVAVGYSTKVLHDTFYRMLIVGAVILLLLFPTTFIGYRLLKRQLQPLENIASQAKSISNTSFLSKRIVIDSPIQELKTIQEAFNCMLIQLQNIFSKEREFFSDAAHTLKTPLAVLRSQVENSNLTHKAQEELLKTIDGTNDTIEDLLFLSRISSAPVKAKPVSLTNIVATLAELAYTLGEDKNIKVSSEIQRNVYINADEKLIQRALSNIVHNAVTYNNPHGSIKLSLQKQAHQTVITVQDTGIGISKKDLANIFTRFFRGENVVGKGSGLGLAISKAVVESLGGKIVIASTFNKGTTVTISFS